MFSFFGSRKSSPEREESAGDNQSSESSASASDYVFVERREDVAGYGNPDLYPTLTLPYPVAPPSLRQPERTTSSGSSSSAVLASNYLAGVPFKLSSKAEYDPDSFVGADISEIMYQIRNFNLSNFDHDFEVEKSVVREFGQENF